MCNTIGNYTQLLKTIRNYSKIGRTIPHLILKFASRVSVVANSPSDSVRKGKHGWTTEEGNEGRKNYKISARILDENFKALPRAGFLLTGFAATVGAAGAATVGLHNHGHGVAVGV